MKYLCTTPIISTFLDWRSKLVYKSIRKYLDENSRILDIGAGSCSICRFLRTKGYDLTPLDVKDLSVFEEIDPIIYDGKRMPFEDNHFGTSLLITVLHHASDPEEILSEAKRVSDKIIIIEDIYDSKLQKFFTYFIDSLVNLKFLQHPHNNKKDEDWRELFEGMGLALKDSKLRKAPSLPIIKQAIYVLEK